MKNTKFATLTLEQKLNLNDLTIDSVFVTEPEMIWITKFLELADKTVDELRAIRNSVVRYYNLEFDKYMDRFEIGRQILANMSGVTATIDNMIFRLGGEV